jgi:TonB family protein
MTNAGEDPAGLPNPEPPSLDGALWMAPPKPTLGESFTGITGSVLAHLVVAGGLLAAAMLAPPREQPGLTEIPVEIVVEPSASLSAELDALAQPALKEPDALPPAPNEPASAQAPDDDAPASEIEQALLPEIPQEPAEAAPSEPTEIAGATISREPGEQSREALAEPIDPFTAPSLSVSASRQPAAAKSNSPETTRRNEPKQAIGRNDVSPRRAQGREERRVTRQPHEAGRRNPIGGGGAPAQAKGAVQAARGMMPRMARVGHATSPPEQGSRAEAAASPGAAASYRSQVIAHLTRFKRYPLGAETRGAEGTPVVSFSLDGGGRIASVALARSSGHSDIDAETLAMVRRAVPFPAPPPGAPQAISAAISFQLR